MAEFFIFWISEKEETASPLVWGKVILSRDLCWNWSSSGGSALSIWQKISAYAVMLWGNCCVVWARLKRIQSNDTSMLALPKRKEEQKSSRYLLRDSLSWKCLNAVFGHLSLVSICHYCAWFNEKMIQSTASSAPFPLKLRHLSLFLSETRVTSDFCILTVLFFMSLSRKGFWLLSPLLYVGYSLCFWSAVLLFLLIFLSEHLLPWLGTSSDLWRFLWGTKNIIHLCFKCIECIIIKWNNMLYVSFSGYFLILLLSQALFCIELGSWAVCSCALK